MARAAEGWKIVWRRGVAHVRFRHEKRRRELTTGTSDPGEAAAAAARIYADAVSGKLGRADAPAGPLSPLADVLALWLVELGATHAENTVELYTMYGRTHWLPFFKRLDGMTAPALANYGRDRLRVVSRDTVQKEIGALRNFLEWCREQHVVDAPPVPKLPKRAMGVRAVTRKSQATEMTPAEVEAWLAELPERSPGKKGGSRSFIVRARFRVQWETGLRPSTLDRLVVPDHYRAGAAELIITDDIDKARFGRTLPLTAAARAALDSVAPKAGPIFGRHDYRDFIRAAAARAGIDPAKVATFSAYDLRHARTQQWTEESGNLPGVGYLVGHTRATTTNKYLRATRRAADKVLAAAATIGGLSGAAAAAAIGALPSAEVATIENETGVRRGGLEPPRCYPLAPQGNGSDLSARNGEADERQPTPEDAQLRQALGAGPPIVSCPAFASWDAAEATLARLAGDEA